MNGRIDACISTVKGILEFLNGSLFKNVTIEYLLLIIVFPDYLFRLALSPLGGSVTILIAFCSTETGKWEAG